MHCLVTGVAGFIGSTLAEKLLADGHIVTGIDCLTDYYDRKLKEANLNTLKNYKKFSFIQADLNSLNLVELLAPINVVFHQSAQAGVRASWGSYFDTYIQHNISATQKLLEAVKTNSHIEKLVYASSSSIYGDAETMPTKESVRPLPVSPYGVTKLAGENLMRLYAREFGVPTVSLRYFTVYGPRQRPEMAFSRFISSALQKKKIQVFGDGCQSRDFTYVDDIVNANILAWQNGKLGAVYNIGGGRVATLKDIFAILESKIDKLDFEFQDRQKGDAMHTSADTTLAKKELGFSPIISLEEGLERQINWLKEQINQ